MSRGNLTLSLVLPITLSLAVMGLSLGSDTTGIATWLVIGVVIFGIVCNEVRARWFSTNVKDLMNGNGRV